MTAPPIGLTSRSKFPRRLVVAASVVIAGSILATPSASAAPLSYYLPSNVTYDTSIPTPDDVLGYGVGDWHIRPDQVIDYMRRLAEASPRVTLEEQGRTHEDRLQILLTFTSPQNHGRLEELRRDHLALSDPNVPEKSADDIAKMPVVIWLGYSIHGNEASGSNASLVAAYHLAAATDSDTLDQLDNAIILLDPMFNPDGLGRFAHWANTHKGNVLVGDPNHREHTEVFPGGRMNHYWFDLNRDWLLLQHPESRNRVVNFHRWKPNLLTDHHEMGTNSTFFFQPGVPERKNPLIPEGNLDLTNRLARFHAAAFDAEDRLYYSKESFDDFYPGKGSTYPDLNGAVGILFEQASSRGHLQESINGDLAFSFGIKNQFLASLSSVKGAVADRVAFLQHQSRFFREAKAQAAALNTKAYVVSTHGDQGRMAHLVDNLTRHQIDVYELGRDLTVDGTSYRASESIVVPLDQQQHILIRSLFEPLTDYTATTFYDVSTWSLPLAFGASYAPLRQAEMRTGILLAKVNSGVVQPAAAVTEEAFAYAFDWTDYHAPRALNRLLQAGHAARVATESFTARTGTTTRQFQRGSIVIPTGHPANADSESLMATFATIAERDGVEVVPLSSGYADGGVDLGSPSLRPLEQPRLMIVVGSGISAYEAGEAWHLLDHRFEMPVSLVEADRVSRIDLSRYTHIVLPGGFYGRFGESFTNAIKEFGRDGGTLIGIKGGAAFLDRSVRERTAENGAQQPPQVEVPDAERTYENYRDSRAEQLVSGTIVEANLDLSHPLAYGYPIEQLPLFRTNTTLLPEVKNPFEVVATYSTPPRLSGYISEQNQERLSGQPAVLASRFGRGTIVQLMDNPNFRAIWYGPTKLFMNAIFFGPIVQNTSAPDTWLD